MADVDMQHPAPRFALVGCSNFIVSLAAFWLCYHYLPLGRIAASLHLPAAQGGGTGAEGAVTNRHAAGAVRVGAVTQRRRVGRRGLRTIRASEGIRGAGRGGNRPGACTDKQRSVVDEYGTAACAAKCKLLNAGGFRTGRG